MNKVPRLKKIVKVTSLNDIEEEKRYWMSKSPLERIEAVENKCAVGRHKDLEDMEHLP